MHLWLVYCDDSLPSKQESYSSYVRPAAKQSDTNTNISQFNIVNVAFKCLQILFNVAASITKHMFVR